jgi:hypothetical protein
MPEERFQCKKRGRRQGVLEFAELSHFGNLQCGFSDIHFVQRHFAADENAPWNMPPGTARSAPPDSRRMKIVPVGRSNLALHVSL